MSVGVRITYGQLLQRHQRVLVPMIQRDYAQGRPNEAEIRDEFLAALETALQKTPDDPTLPLNLDFVYGSVESEDSSFLPLDGQQRLTTLFLLHWHLAWVDNRWGDFAAMFLATDGLSRFTYRVRPSSNDFFDALVAFRPRSEPSEVTMLSELIRDQPWYFRSWRLDPTIQSVLGMLDAIHHRFEGSTGLFGRLTDAQAPAVTFQLLDLNNFGLSDDLYIKMNARGKPLTPFETFKARYEHELQAQFHGVTFAIGTQRFSAADYISRRLDTTWADLFWSLRDPKSDAYDAALINLFRAVALISRDPESSAYPQDVGELRSHRAPTYSDFHQRHWLDDGFTLTLMRLLDAWRAVDGKLVSLLSSPRYFDEGAIFERIGHAGGNLPYTDVVQFAAYAMFVRSNHGGIDPAEFEQWMRIVYNLSINTGYNRSEDLRRSIAGLVALIGDAHRAEQYLADAANPVSGFSEPQIAEERLKAQLLLADPAWRPLLERAEGHGYFRGQIDFILDFAGVIAAAAERPPASWTDDQHEQMRARFGKQLRLAELMFSGHGLQDVGEQRWQRALLTFGDYLLSSGRNRSFLANSTTEEGSWKRLLRGGAVAQRRDTLRRLWTQLSPDDPLAPQLDRVIGAATQLEPWREVLVRTPSALAYCEKHCIRWDNDTIFLLKRFQLNGAHAELFTYCLYRRLGRTPAAYPLLGLGYFQVTDTLTNPYLSVRARGSDSELTFTMRYLKNRFMLYASKPMIEAIEGLDDQLRDRGFTFDDEWGFKWSDRDDVDVLLADINNAFRALESPAGG